MVPAGSALQQKITGDLKTKTAGKVDEVNFGRLESGIQIVKALFIFQIDVKGSQGQTNTSTYTRHSFVYSRVTIGKQPAVILNPGIIVVIDK